MSSTFPTKLSDDYVPASYLRGGEMRNDELTPTPQPPGDPLRFIAFRSGPRLLAMTALLLK